MKHVKLQRTSIRIAPSLTILHYKNVYFDITENKDAIDLCVLYGDKISDPKYVAQYSNSVSRIEEKTFSLVRLSNKTKHKYYIEYQSRISSLYLFFIIISISTIYCNIDIRIPRFIYKLFIKCGMTVNDDCGTTKPRTIKHL